MAFPVIESLGTFNAQAGDSSSVVLAKPSGLAQGDIMVAHLGSQGNYTITTPAGWTEIDTTAMSSRGRSALFYKVVLAEDVAASTFTFNKSGSGGFIGIIMRISAFDADTPAPNVNSAYVVGPDEDDTLTTAGITPDEDSLILLTGCLEGNATVNNYAIVTSNPSWTEQYDQGNGSNIYLFCAAGDRAASSATGNATATSSSEWLSWVYQITEIKFGTGGPMPSGPATLKTFNTVATASTKTIDTAAIASVKTINTAA